MKKKLSFLLIYTVTLTRTNTFLMSDVYIILDQLMSTEGTKNKYITLIIL